MLYSLPTDRIITELSDGIFSVRLLRCAHSLLDPLASRHIDHCNSGTPSLDCYLISKRSDHRQSTLTDPLVCRLFHVLYASFGNFYRYGSSSTQINAYNDIIQPYLSVCPSDVSGDPSLRSFFVPFVRPVLFRSTFVHTRLLISPKQYERQNVCRAEPHIRVAILKVKSSN